MLALAIVLAVLVLIALLRFGVIVEYSEIGFELWVKAGFIKFKTVGEDVTNKRKIKELRKKLRKNIKKKIKRDNAYLKDMIPGSMGEFMDTLKAVFNMLGRFKRRLLIKQLTLYYISAGEDPANTALQFGAANAVFEGIMPQIKKNFRVRRLDMRAGFDFTSGQQKIYAKAILSIAVWEAVYAIIALFPIIIAIFKKMPKRNKSRANTNTEKPENIDRKDGQNDGKETDQRIDGNNDAKNEGDD